MKVAIASGKGGTGKTSISLAMFQAIQGRGKVVLVDADVEEPDCRLFLRTEPDRRIDVTLPVARIDAGKCQFSGECARVCRFGALAVIPGRQVMVFDDMCIGCGACVIACPNKAVYEVQRSQGSIEVATTAFGTLITGLVKVGTHSPVRVIEQALASVPADADVVIVDSPPGASDAMVHAVRDADFVVLVAEPTRFGTHDVGVVIQALQRLGKPLGVVINKAGIGDGGLQTLLAQRGVDVLLEIPFSREAAQALAVGGTLADVFDWLPGKLLNLFEKIQEMV